MPSKKAGSAEAVSEPEVQGDLASGSEPDVAAEAAASEPVAPHAEAPARYIALRHLIHDLVEYYPGDSVAIRPGPFEHERQFAARIAELKASGAIKEA